MKVVIPIILFGVAVSIYAHPVENPTDFNESTGDAFVVNGLSSKIPASQKKARHFDYDCETMLEIISTLADIPDNYILVIKEDPDVLLNLLRAEPSLVHQYMRLLDDLLNFCVNTTMFEKFVTDRDGPVMTFIDKLRPELDVRLAQSSTPITTVEDSSPTQEPVTTVKDPIFTPEELEQLRSEIPSIDILLAKVEPGRIGLILQLISNFPDMISPWMNGCSNSSTTILC
ncbi:hypothetical protein Aperf_G00000101196 [Anoplocephala perfoliata]